MLSDVYFPRVNGVSTSIQTFRRTLAGLGVRVTVVAPDYPEGRQRHRCRSGHRPPAVAHRCRSIRKTA
jgi:1,2-diacylglycerol 3-alpha-glucosyltransferase